MLCNTACWLVACVLTPHNLEMSSLGWLEMAGVCAIGGDEVWRDERGYVGGVGDGGF